MSHEFTDPFERASDADARYLSDQEADWHDHRDELRRERLAEHVTPDPKPAKRVLRKDAPKPDAEWRESVFERDQGCIVHTNPAECGEGLNAHHAITQAELRRRQLTAFLWRREIGVTICGLAHRQHHWRKRPIFWEELPLETRQMIVALGFELWASNHYPRREQVAA